MKPPQSTALQTPKAAASIREAAFFISVFCWTWLRINPALYNQRHDPIFLLDWNFFKEAVNRPGGPLEYLASLLSQLYYFPVWGALIIALAAWTVSRLTAAVIGAIRPGHHPTFVQYIPSILLMALHGHYSHPLATTLGLLLFLIAVLIHFQLEGGISVRMVGFMAIGLMLYYSAAGYFLLFALMCVLYEWLYQKRMITGMVYVLFTLAVVWTAKTWLFLVSDRMAFLDLLPFKETYQPVFTPYLLIFFYPALMIVLHPYLLKRFESLNKFHLRNGRLRFGFQTVVLFALLGAAAVFSYRKNVHALLQADYYARHERWEDLVQFSLRERSGLLPVEFQTNRALFHTGRLLESMFSFSQTNGASGLMLPRTYGYSAPLQESDFCWDIGSINESRHWAYEAVSTDGETPWILKRMAVVNFISGDYRAAERCLNVLDKTLFLKNWARRFREYLRSPELASESPLVKHGRSMLIKTDFITANNHSPGELDTLLAVNPRNKMAFEYRMAHELLTCRLGGLPKHVEALNQFGYTVIPRHVEEGLLSLWAMSKQREMPPMFKFIRRETIQRFGEFNQTFSKYRNDRSAAKPELRLRFGNTFWYYLFYNNPMLRQAASSSRAGGVE